MVAENFDRSLANVLVDEGGNDDDPDDSGGRTSRGIIQKEFNAYRHLKGEPPLDVWKASDVEIADIYRTQYWYPLCNQLPSGVDYLYFDMAVNTGPAEGAKLLQRGVGVFDDGHVGVITMAAVKDADPSTLINNVSNRRRDFYLSLHKAKYVRGWLRRVERVRGIAQKMVVPPQPAPSNAA